MLKVAYITAGGTVHDERWLAKLREHFDVTTLLDKPVDIIQAGPIGGITYSMVRYAQRLGAKFVLMSWGFDVLENEITPAVEESIDHADMFLCDSDVVREKLLSLRMTPAPPVVQIPWGVDLEMFKPSSEPPKHQLVTRNRGVGMALDAFGKTRLYTWGFAVPGGTNHEAMPTLYRQAWAYICASRSDGTSVSLLEAMACGLPVIVTDNGGNREWVTQGVNGWLCEIGNAQSFADAIVECARMSAYERKTMGMANRGVVEAKADWHRNFEERLVPAYHTLACK